MFVIIAVLIVHEAGHYTAMKLFGYTNVQMFFIPLMGAGVSGRSRNAPAWKKAAVTLAGPLPGIFIGFALLIVSLIVRREILFMLGLTFIGLNLFNLLPIYPLDGGRFLQEVLFVRNRYVELVANILAALAMLGAAAALGSWFFAILGILNILSIRFKFKLAKGAQYLRADLRDDELRQQADEDEIPDTILEKILHWMSQSMPGPLKPEAAANMATDLWQRIRVRPPRAGATVALLCVFAMGYGASVLSLGSIALLYAFSRTGDSRVVQYTAPDGTTHYKEQQYIMGKLSAETELTDDKQYYDGQHTAYDFSGKVIGKGQWEMGKRVGIWLTYNDEGVIVTQTEYDGKPIATQTFDNEGGWTRRTWEDYSQAEKTLHEKTAPKSWHP